MQLRDYQTAAVAETQRLIAEVPGANPAIVISTGGGKTVCMGYLTAQYQPTHYQAAIAHRRELVSQIALAYAKYKIPHRIIGPSTTVQECRRAQLEELGYTCVDQSARVGVCPVDTLAARDMTGDAWARSVAIQNSDWRSASVTRMERRGNSARALATIPATTLLRLLGTRAGRDGITPMAETRPSQTMTLWLSTHWTNQPRTNMLNITITEQTPHNMLRAIRAACNELLGETHADLTTRATQLVTEADRLNVAANSQLDQAAACLSAHNAQGGPIDAGQFYRVGDQVSEQTVLGPLAYGGSQTGTGAIETPPQNIPKSELTPTVEMDSTGAEWNPELHASTKAKNQDGMWKKRRGVGSQTTTETVARDDAAALVPLPSDTPALPPLPPALPATPLVTMNDIYALITNGKAVLNDVIAAAQAMGFADVGAFSRDATPEQRAQLLAQLTKEAA